MLATIIGGLVEQTLRELSDEPDQPFGGFDIVLMGDQMQLKCVGGESIPRGMVFNALGEIKEKSLFSGDKTHYIPDSSKPSYRFRSLLTSFHKIELKQLVRARDPELRTLINEIRSFKSLRPLTLEMLRKIKPLTKDDVENEPKWLSLSVAVTTNAERHPINLALGLNLAVVTGCHLLGWRKPFKDSRVYGNPELCEQLYNDPRYESELIQLFQCGARIPLLTKACTTDSCAVSASVDVEDEEDPVVMSEQEDLSNLGGRGMLTENVNPLLNMANGSMVILYGISYDNITDLARMHAAIDASLTDKLVIIPVPSTVFVEVTAGDVKDWPDNCSLIPGRFVFPLTLGGKGFKDSKSSIKVHYSKPVRGTLNIEYKQFRYNFGIATTDYKLQGAEKDCMAINLNQRIGSSFSSLTVESFNVLISRVSALTWLRRFPWLTEKPEGMSDEDFDDSQLLYLTKLRLDPFKVIWFKCYDEESGLWNPLPPDRLYFLMQVGNLIEKINTNYEKTIKTVGRPPNLDYDEQYQILDDLCCSTFQSVLNGGEIPDFKTLPSNISKVKLPRREKRKSGVGLKSKRSMVGTATHLLGDIHCYQGEGKLGIQENATNILSLSITNSNSKSSMSNSSSSSSSSSNNSILNNNTLSLLTGSGFRGQRIERFPSPRGTQVWNMLPIESTDVQDYLKTILLRVQQKGEKDVVLVYITPSIPYKCRNFACFENWLDDETIDGMLTIFKRSRPKNYERVTILNSQFYDTMHEFGTGYNFERISRWTSEKKDGFKNGTHLDTPILTIIHLPSHWVYVCILPAGHVSNDVNFPLDATFNIFDGFQNDHKAVILNWQCWYRDEHMAHGRGTGPFLRPVYHYNFDGSDTSRPRDIAQVRDGVSCGVSGLGHAMYSIMFNKFFATWEDFSYDHIHELRCYLMKILIQYIDENLNGDEVLSDLGDDVLDISDEMLFVSGSDDHDLEAGLKASIELAKAHEDERAEILKLWNRQILNGSKR